jgi:hypothetical protein
VDLEVAKLLKEAGFDWKCKYAYIITPAGDMPTGEEGTLTESEIDTNWLAQSPTLDVAQRWLREVKSIEAVPWRWPTKVLFVSGYKPWSYKLIEYRDLEGVDIEDFNASGEDYFKTYEEAQEAGIQKVLEMILQIANAE